MSRLFDLSMAIYEGLNDGRNVDLMVKELFSQLDKLYPDPTPEDYESACDYYANGESFGSRDLESKLKLFAESIYYWSDRWCYERYFTAQRYWEDIKGD